MRKAPWTVFVFAVVLAGPSPAVKAADWITSRSTFTHNPRTGQRVDQYAPEAPVVYYEHPNYRTSGMRHLRSSVQVGPNADNSHVVESWGEEVRPYGEWRFPYRPYSVPYPAWGQPPGWGGGFGFGVGGAGVGNGYLDPYGGSPYPEQRPGRRQRHSSPPRYPTPYYDHPDGGAGSGGAGVGPGPGGRGPNGMRPRPTPRVFPRDPSRPATPDRWRPYHDGGYPTLPRDFYQPAY